MCDADQLDLFSRGRAPAGTRGPRRALDATSWVDHLRGWYADSDRLFAALRVVDGWEQRSRWMFTKAVVEPRLTNEFRILEQAPVDEVRQIGARISSTYGVPYDSAWLNLYRDENDSTSWHADRPANRPLAAVVPVLSLGATRRFLLRPKTGGKTGGRSVTLTVAAGDLVVMGGRCQRDWVHAVPKETDLCGLRISVNFGSSVQT